MDLNDQTIDVFRNEVKSFQDIDREIAKIKDFIKPYQEKLKHVI